MKVEKIKIGLAGNPNVGKSTVFNALTGLKQHTGNWPGKTVESAVGNFVHGDTEIIIYDLPGTYSLISHSKEEEVTRDFICNEEYDAITVVCDAVCLERNLNLVLQILELTKNVIVCVNLIDEAKKKGIEIDFKKLSKCLNVPVIPICARDKKGLEDLILTIKEVARRESKKMCNVSTCLQEQKINIVENLNEDINESSKKNKSLKEEIEHKDNWKEKIKPNDNLKEEIEQNDNLKEKIKQNNNLKILEKTEKFVQRSERISKEVVEFKRKDYANRDRKIDKILTSKTTGIPIMIFLLLVVFWITIVGANYPSEMLFDFFENIGEKLYAIFEEWKVPSFITGVLLYGGYKVLTWVVAVMLPPMAIFFPLFTLLEDLGYLPRIAFNMDKMFRRCNACGKQALTMCMGFGCNACGIIGARIIDSPRERLIAIITNNFVPCNGRFPTLISIISMFFVGVSTGLFSSVIGVLILVGIILFGIFMTFVVSKILSKTLLKGEASSFTLELPPYRAPKVGSVIVRSIFDRTLFVLGRAIIVALPAGIVIWLFANINISGLTILEHCTNFLQPFGNILGLDGVILMAFILGFPANEFGVQFCKCFKLTDTKRFEKHLLTKHIDF